jgi:hypothetical protein
MKLELRDGVMSTQEEKDIIKMLKSRFPKVGFGVNRTYQNTDKKKDVLKIRVENTLLTSSDKFTNVWIKPIYN